MEDEKEKVERLKTKSEDSAVNVVKKVLAQPEVQKTLKSNINKQTFVSGLFMAFILIGFLMLSNVAKELIGYNWVGDMIIGIVLIVIGGLYVIRGMRQK